MRKITFIIALLCTTAAGSQSPNEVIEDLCLLCVDVAPLCEQEQPGDILASIESFTSSVDKVYNDEWWPLDQPTVYDRIKVSFVVELSPALFEPHEPGVAKVYNLDWQTTSRARFDGNMVGAWKNTIIYLQLRQDGRGVWYVQLGTMWGVSRRGTQLKESIRLSSEVPNGAYHFDVDVDRSRVRTTVILPDGSERRVAVATPDGGPLLHQGVFARFNHTGDEKGNEKPLQPGANWFNFEVMGYPVGGIMVASTVNPLGPQVTVSDTGDYAISFSFIPSCPEYSAACVVPQCKSGSHQLIYNIERLSDGLYKHYWRYVCDD